MSKYKIVKKHGRLEKRKIHRALPYDSFKYSVLSLLGIHNSFTQEYTHLPPNSLEARLLGPDFIIFALLNKYNDYRRMGRLGNMVWLMHDGRGMKISLSGGWDDPTTLGIQEVLRAHWRHFEGWDLSYNTRIEGIDGLVVGVEITLYPSVWSVTYNVCKRLYAAKGSEGFGHAGRVIDEFLMTSDEIITQALTKTQV